MRIACISGWGQPHDALSDLCPQAHHIAYGHIDSVDTALTHIAGEIKDADILVGWSLGGQLLLRTLHSHNIRPRGIVLIAPPYQFVAQDTALGMPRDQYEQFLQNYTRNPQRTLDKVAELIVYNDKHADRIRESHFKPAEERHALHWSYWLEELERFSCDHIDMESLPNTLLIYGKGDVVVAHEQAELFTKRWPSIRHITFEECGHAPHWHDGETLRTLMAEHFHV